MSDHDRFNITQLVLAGDFLLPSLLHQTSDFYGLKRMQGKNNYRIQTSVCIVLVHTYNTGGMIIHRMKKVERNKR